jgi:hypothetical protein
MIGVSLSRRLWIWPARLRWVLRSTAAMYCRDNVS